MFAGSDKVVSLSESPPTRCWTLHSLVCSSLGIKNYCQAPALQGINVSVVLRSLLPYCICSSIPHLTMSSFTAPEKRGRESSGGESDQGINTRNMLTTEDGKLTQRKRKWNENRVERKGLRIRHLDPSKKLESLTLGEDEDTEGMCIKSCSILFLSYPNKSQRTNVDAIGLAYSPISARVDTLVLAISSLLTWVSSVPTHLDSSHLYGYSELENNRREHES